MICKGVRGVKRRCKGGVQSAKVIREMPVEFT